MRVLAPVPFLVAGAIACNAIVGNDKLEKTRTGDPKEASGKPCDPTKDFGDPVALTGPVASGDFNGYPSLTSDELTIVFQRSTTPANGTIFMAHRASIDVEFGAAIPISELEQGDVSFTPSIRADGLVIFWAEPASPTRLQVMFATRASPTAPFANPQAFPATSSSTADDSSPSVSVDGEEMFFSSDRASSTSRRIHRTVRKDGAYGPPAEVTELHSNVGSEQEVVLTPDGLTAYFGSSRSGAGDIYTAHRTSKTSPFVDIKLITSVSSDEVEYPGAISPDNCRLYFTRATESEGKILVATRGAK